MSDLLDPFGLRDAWLRTQHVVSRLANRKFSKEENREESEDGKIWQREGSLDKIRAKVG